MEPDMTDNPWDGLMDTLCVCCGHTGEDHDSGAGLRECWNESGDGNKCDCELFETE